MSERLLVFHCLTTDWWLCSYQDALWWDRRLLPDMYRSLTKYHKRWDAEETKIDENIMRSTNQKANISMILGRALNHRNDCDVDLQSDPDIFNRFRFGACMKYPNHVEVASDLAPLVALQSLFLSATRSPLSATRTSSRTTACPELSLITRCELHFLNGGTPAHTVKSTQAWDSNYPYIAIVLV